MESPTTAPSSTLPPSPQTPTPSPKETPSTEPASSEPLIHPKSESFEDYKECSNYENDGYSTSSDRRSQGDTEADDVVPLLEANNRILNPQREELPVMDESYFTNRREELRKQLRKEAEGGNEMEETYHTNRTEERMKQSREETETEETEQVEETYITNRREELKKQLKEETERERKAEETHLTNRSEERTKQLKKETEGTNEPEEMYLANRREELKKQLREETEREREREKTYLTNRKEELKEELKKGLNEETERARERRKQYFSSPSFINWRNKDGEVYESAHSTELGGTDVDDGNDNNSSDNINDGDDVDDDDGDDIFLEETKEGFKNVTIDEKEQSEKEVENEHCIDDDDGEDSNNGDDIFLEETKEGTDDGPINDKERGEISMDSDLPCDMHNNDVPESQNQSTGAQFCIGSEPRDLFQRNNNNNNNSVHIGSNPFFMLLPNISTTSPNSAVVRITDTTITTNINNHKLRTTFRQTYANKSEKKQTDPMVRSLLFVPPNGQIDLEGRRIPSDVSVEVDGRRLITRYCDGEKLDHRKEEEPKKNEENIVPDSAASSTELERYRNAVRTGNPAFFFGNGGNEEEEGVGGVKEERSKDCLSLSVVNLSPGQTAIVTITYEETIQKNDRVCFVVPSSPPTLEGLSVPSNTTPMPRMNYSIFGIGLIFQWLSNILRFLLVGGQNRRHIENNDMLEGGNSVVSFVAIDDGSVVDQTTAILPPEQKNNDKKDDPSMFVNVAPIDAVGTSTTTTAPVVSPVDDEENTTTAPVDKSVIESKDNAITPHAESTTNLPYVRVYGSIASGSVNSDVSSLPLPQDPQQSISTSKKKSLRMSSILKMAFITKKLTKKTKRKNKLKKVEEKENRSNTNDLSSSGRGGNPNSTTSRSVHTTSSVPSDVLLEIERRKTLSRHVISRQNSDGSFPSRGATQAITRLEGMVDVPAHKPEVCPRYDVWMTLLVAEYLPEDDVFGNADEVDDDESFGEAVVKGYGKEKEKALEWVRISTGAEEEVVMKWREAARRCWFKEKVVKFKTTE